MRRTLWMIGLSCSVAAACELQEVTTAAPADFVVAEVVLQAGADTQFAYLQRSLGREDVEVSDARVSVVDARGDTLRFQPTDAMYCLQPLPQQDHVIGTCYTALAPTGWVRPGGEYQLRVALADGGRLLGTTRVPGPIELVRPAAAECALPPDTTLELVWRAAEGAWVYDVEAKLADIFPALVKRGVVPDTPNVPLRLDGLAITETDTTLVLPSEFGLFDRFDADVHPILLAIRRGLPEGVTGEVVVAAADRNYVNWARGGSFNPSGMVRVPSVRGDGTGVFGSMTAARFRLKVTRETGLPPCF